jgi:translation initiation factor eIF-2B subunit alpha
MSSQSPSLTNPPLPSPISPPNLPPSPYTPLSHYHHLLSTNPSLSMPIAAITVLLHLLQTSSSNTMQGLIMELQSASDTLSRSVENPLSLNAGTELFLRFVTAQRMSSDRVSPPPLPPNQRYHHSYISLYRNQSFDSHKSLLSSKLTHFISSTRLFPSKISSRLHRLIPPSSTLLLHAHSRIVLHSILTHPSSSSFRILITESRPLGLGLLTHRALKEKGISSTLILDSSVAYHMQKVDYVLLGGEAVGISGGLINFIGSFQISMIAKSFGKPVYALVESFKFSRIFPLSQSDIPINPKSTNRDPPLTPMISFASKQLQFPSKDDDKPLLMSQEMVDKNPLVDFTPSEYISLVVSDIGVLTTEGVSDTLLSVFGGE